MKPLRALLPVYFAAQLAWAGIAAAGIQLKSWYDVSPDMAYVDVWGWIDPATQIPYALVGNNGTGLHIIDISDPYSPNEVAKISTVVRYDMKTWGTYLYVVDGNFGNDGAVVDLSNPTSPVVVGTLPPAHNIWVDEQGFLFTAQPGLVCYDLRADPTAPTEAWSIDTSDGHDAVVVGNTLYDFHGNVGTFIWNVTNRLAPAFKGLISDPAITYHHQGWPTADGRHLFIADEYALHPSPDITVWNIENPAAPQKVGAIYNEDATAHNCYVLGDYLMVAYYTAGFCVYDISVPETPSLVDAYDTTAQTGEGIFSGAWGCYPFMLDGSILVTDRPGGLFVFSFEEPTSAGTPAVRAHLGTAYPNPFNPSTTIPFSLDAAADVTLDVFSAEGKRVRSLVRGLYLAGSHTAQWDGHDDDGRRVASGVYFARMRAAGSKTVVKMTLMK